jgi:hypothetical protein
MKSHMVTRPFTPHFIILYVYYSVLLPCLVFSLLCKYTTGTYSKLFCWGEAYYGRMCGEVGNGHYVCMSFLCLSFFIISFSYTISYFTIYDGMRLLVSFLVDLMR